jgi:recombination protein RecR
MTDPRPPHKNRTVPSGEAAREASGLLPGASRVLLALVEELERLPGIGRRTAERLAYHVLRMPEEEAMRLAYAIRDVKKTLRHCATCFHVTDAEECAICRDPERDRSKVCVVETPKDVYAIESTGSYRGLYHVLLGAFAPLDGVRPEDLTIEPLVERVRRGGITEVILATNPNFEGDGTALLLKARLSGVPGLRLTRLARGLPSGSQIEHASRTIVQDALEGRREMEE